MDHASNYISTSPKLVSKTFGCSLAHSNKLLTHIPQTQRYSGIQSSLYYVEWLPMGQISVAVIYVYTCSKSEGFFLKEGVQIYGALLLFLFGVGNFQK